MPEPISNFSTDKYIYKLTKAISPYLCHISPNIISITGFLFIIPILGNLAYRRGLYELLILAFIKQFFDCLDGTVARTCNTGSVLGAKLDILLDTIFGIIISIYVFQHIIYKPGINIYTKYFVAAISITIIYQLTNYLCKKLKADKEGRNIDEVELGEAEIFHDNSVLITVSVFLIIKLLI